MGAKCVKRDPLIFKQLPIDPTFQLFKTFVSQSYWLKIPRKTASNNLGFKTPRY